MPAANMYRRTSVWDSGAFLTWSSDGVVYPDFVSWNPYFGMEVGVTLRITDRTLHEEDEETYVEPFPPLAEWMTIEEVLSGCTINGAFQLGIDDAKDSIAADKDAEFLVFDQDLTAVEKEGSSNILPADVFFCGKKVN